MDPLTVAAGLSRIGHAHAKDVVFNHDELAVNGLLDRRWSAADPGAPWTFATVGRGHDAAWWRSFLSVLAERGVETISIEHEDPTVPAEQGIRDAASVLASTVAAEVH
jgi:sugar phosphate isomerase/epimerase